MKTSFQTLFLLTAFAASAQVPNYINYQGVARDAAGAPIVS